MTKKNLVFILVTLCLLVSLVITTGGSAAQATATAKWPIYALAGPGGSISPAGIVLVTEGKSPAFTITPKAGWHIVDVLVDGLSKKAELVKNKYTFPAVTGPHRILALFSASLVINAGASEGGTISPSGLIKLLPNGSQTFVITPNTDDGFYIANVIVNGIRVGPVPKYTFRSIKDAQSIIALFERKYPVLATAGQHGSVSPSGVNMYEAGDSQLFTFNPEPGYRVVDVRVNEEWQGALASYNLTNIHKPCNIMVLFSNEYAVVSKAGTGGKIIPSGPTTVTYDSSLAFTITPNNGYYLSEIKLDGNTVPSIPFATQSYIYTLNNIQSNHSVIALFTKGTPPAQ
jgi:hypothetical protein